MTKRTLCHSCDKFKIRHSTGLCNKCHKLAKAGHPLPVSPSDPMLAVVRKRVAEDERDARQPLTVQAKLYATMRKSDDTRLRRGEESSFEMHFDHWAELKFSNLRGETLAVKVLMPDSASFEALAELRRPVKPLTKKEWVRKEVARHKSKLTTPATKRAKALTDKQIAVELKSLGDQWDADRADEDDEGHAGSPGEWLVERMGELETEQNHRAKLKAILRGDRPGAKP